MEEDAVKKHYKKIGKAAQKAIKKKYGKDGMRIIGSNGVKKRWEKYRKEHGVDNSDKKPLA